MNFAGRLQNTIHNLVEKLLFHFYHYPMHQEIYEKSFPDSKDFRPFWSKVRTGASLVLMNSHYTLNYPRPFVPNVIEVAGMHVKKTANPLPDDIKKFIDDSDGIVYFSLGGNIKPSQMPIEKQQAIINALSKVKNEKILWKWDDESAKVDKKKFLIKKWFPQDDILAHPKVKVFITHGGLLSGTEAIYNGKPLIVIPIFGDQKLNAARSVLNGFGVRVDYNNLTEESLSWGLNEILNNKKYSLRVQELSNRFNDKPIHPVDLAKFHVEYVIRHKGAFFMQSSATQLNFIELNNIDVIILIGLILGALIFVPFLIVRKIFKICCGSAKKVENVTKKKKKN
jgi:UDP:flavonoid glycosyltransferase YjiC (YdhE family)